jgi:hypothetical protein
MISVLINNNIPYYLMLTFRVRALRGELHGFRDTWLRCNFLEWNGALKRRPRGSAQRGSAAQGMPLSRATREGRPHSASLRLALHLKNRPLHPVQLPDLG